MPGAGRMHNQHMKNACEKRAADTLQEKSGRKLRVSFSSRLESLRHGSLRCPLCGETYTGIKALLSHLKDHCT